MFNLNGINKFAVSMWLVGLAFAAAAMLLGMFAVGILVGRAI